jgi:hypothetical protein
VTPVARPGSPGDLRRVAAGNALGFLLIAVGWGAASGEVTLRSQSRWAVLSVTGLTVAGAGNAAFLRRGRRAVTLAARRFVVRDAPVPESAPAAVSGAPGDVFVAGRGLTLFHRPECRLVAGKPVTAEQRSAHEQAGREPCQVCRP